MYNPHMSSNKRTTLLFGIVAVLSLALGIGFNLKQQATPDPGAEIPELLWPKAKQIMPFKLFDHDANEFGLEQLKGHWSLMFFGYTHCPDVCPTTMMLLNKMVSSIEQPELIPSVYFVSIDPQRDQPAKLSEYVNYFNPEFIGVSGEPAQLAYFARQIGILFARVETEEPENYIMDHSSSILLIDPTASISGIFSTPHDADKIKQTYLRIRDFIEAQND